MSYEDNYETQLVSSKVSWLWKYSGTQWISLEVNQLWK